MECLRDTFYDGVVLDGRFETVSPLNHGSFGMVFMAKDLTTNEFVAIKCLTKKSATSDFDSSFAVDERSEELACHGKLGSHPNIVNLIHSFETEAHIYIVLEFCSRGDLYEAIRTGTGPLETEHVRQFMLQLVDAVAYIHSKGMYHRDIKPENIFLTQAGEMKLGDFGLATSDTWTYETTVGSDRYMSPEQYDSAGAGYSPEKADIWAIGICLLNILFSRNPFTTPTESDPLFLDFSRDKQSLFDVFPNMSQDTYEVISQCMSLDPRKRSLDGVREALERVVSFSVFDDPMDDFLSVPDKPVVASANREPLRTPSIQSPQVDTGSFPWAKALQASPPQQFRQLSAIPDDESCYSEDLFPSSEESQKDWFSVGEQTPSMASIMESSLASMHSMAIRRPVKMPKAAMTPISGSLPITMSKPMPLPSMSSVFGRNKDTVSKSWSDLWDEDIEEEEEEAEKLLKARQIQNARSWSHESTHDDDTIRQGGPLQPKNSSFANIQKSKPELAPAVANDIDSDLIADGFFFHDAPRKADEVHKPRYSPPSKRTSVDKWSALGERRRAYTGSSESGRSPELWKGRRDVGLGFSGFGAKIWDNKAHTVVKDKGKECPWVKERAPDPRSRKLHGDLEWVGGHLGGWNDLHL